ncbi:MAG: family 1 glycosylhydrolase [Saprospiraceae bacterium]
MRLEFPKVFFWGSSTSAAQTETATAHNWKGFKAKDGFVFERTTDHELRREEDIGYIKQFGKVYRCSVDWAKLQAAPFAPFDEVVVEEYQTFFAQLNDEGIDILFVFHHFAQPIWFEEMGGWLTEDTISAFVNFAQQCCEHFGDYVFNWNTFNEPNVYALASFLAGRFPPFKKSLKKANLVLKNLGLAHNIVYDVVKASYPNKWVGISMNTVWAHAKHPLGYLPAWLFERWYHKKTARIFKKVDYWGISYYAYIPFTPFPITEIDKPGKLARRNMPHDKMWGYEPRGLYRILKKVHRWQKKPIIIIENGICTDDSQVRIQSIKDYLKLCHQAIAEGLDIKGYIHWSTWDNFEWNLGPTYRFGLVQVDLVTKNRKMTAAGDFYARVCEENAITI